MRAIRDGLLKTVEELASVGRAADDALVAEEARHATTPSNDERVLQTLGALSREIWIAHKAVLDAIRATRQYEGLKR